MTDSEKKFADRVHAVAAALVAKIGAQNFVENKEQIAKNCVEIVQAIDSRIAKIPVRP